MISSMIYLKKGIIMKTTKRILAMITALVLCFALMYLPISAANYVCEHYQTQTIVRGTRVDSYKAAQDRQLW